MKESYELLLQWCVYTIWLQCYTIRGSFSVLTSQLVSATVSGFSRSVVVTFDILMLTGFLRLQLLQFHRNIRNLLTEWYAKIAKSWIRASPIEMLNTTRIADGEAWTIMGMVATIILRRKRWSSVRGWKNFFAKSSKTALGEQTDARDNLYTSSDFTGLRNGFSRSCKKTKKDREMKTKMAKVTSFAKWPTSVTIMRKMTRIPNQKPSKPWKGPRKASRINLCFTNMRKQSAVRTTKINGRI